MGVTNAGKEAFADLAGGVNSIDAFTYLALGGSASSAFSATQTALEDEITASGLTRAATSNTLSTTTTASDTLKLSETWTASSGATIKEIGVFNASSAGTMCARSVLGTPRTLTTGNTYTANYKIIFA